MLGIWFAIFISVILPIGAFIYGLVKSRWLPFVLGMLAFVLSQLMLRLPLLDVLHSKSSQLMILQSTRPIVYFLLIGFSAGIFEGVARYLLIKFFIRDKSWLSGFMFGFGHGGIEAFLIVGLGALGALFTPISFLYGMDYFLAGIERTFAIILHIGLTIVILRSVVEKKIIYLFIAIFLHGVVDSAIGIIPLFFEDKISFFIIEGNLILVALVSFVYSLYLKRRGRLT